MSGNYIDFAQMIKDRVTMEDVALFYGFKITPAGFISCPFHLEKTASLKIYNGNKGWHCFGCGEGGDIFDFVVKYFDIGFPQAVEKINNDFCLGFPLDKPTGKEAKQAKRKADEFRRKREAEQKKHDSLMKKYISALEWWIILDRIKLEYIPAENDINELYEFACKNIDAAAYDLDIAEGNLRSYEMRVKA